MWRDESIGCGNMEQAHWHDVEGSQVKMGFSSANSGCPHKSFLSPYYVADIILGVWGFTDEKADMLSTSLVTYRGWQIRKKTTITKTRMTLEYWKEGKGKVMLSEAQ